MLLDNKKKKKKMTKMASASVFKVEHESKGILQHSAGVFINRQRRSKYVKSTTYIAAAAAVAAQTQSLLY